MEEKKLEPIHDDLCDIISQPTSDGNRDIFFMVDDYNHAMWVFY